MEDVLLRNFFEPQTWERAIEKAVNKGIDKAELRKLTSPEVRLALYQHIKADRYEIAPPHQMQIPKDNGEFRTVYINENIDRVFLSIANELFFEIFPELIHKSCKSYQKGIGCGKVVKQVSQIEVASPEVEVGVKLDLSKYFDTVPIEFIDCIFNAMEKKVGKSKIIDIVRKYYHTDLCFDSNGEILRHYQSLKQGCAVASFLADAVLYPLDDLISKMGVFYVRYSDDLLILGKKWREAYAAAGITLATMGLKLNPSKVEVVRKDRWVKFLGFEIKGEQISLAKSRVKDFQTEIEKRTIAKKNISPKQAVNQVNAYLYKGDGKYSWSTSVLPIINVDKDIAVMNIFILDCLRACETGKKKVGGLGCVTDREDYTLLRGVGRNVSANRAKTEKEIEGYMSLECMRNALLTDRALFETLVRLL